MLTSLGKACKVGQILSFMKETSLLVAPLFSLDSIQEFLYKDINDFQDELRRVLKAYDTLPKRAVLFAPLPLLVSVRLRSFEKTYTTDVIVDAFKKEKTILLPLPYLLGLLQKQKVVWSFFPRYIQSIEMIDPLCTLVRLGSEHSVCLRRIDGKIVLALSEYVQDGMVNASQRLSPTSVQFLVGKLPEEDETVSTYTNSIDTVRQETAIERHLRLTNAMIG